MDALAQRLDLLEQEVRKLRKRVRDSELKDQLTLDNPLNAPSIAGDTVRALFGYQGPQFEQSDIGLGSTPYTYIDHQVTGGESLLTLTAIHSNLPTPSQPYGQIILDSAGEVRIRTSGPGTGQPTTTVTFDENGIAVGSDLVVTEANANWVDLTDGGATTLHSHAISGYTRVYYKANNGTSGTGPAVTTSETSLGSFTITGGDMGTTGIMRVKMGGTFTGSGASTTVTIRVKLGSTTLYADASAATTSANVPWFLEAWLANVGSASIQRLGGFVLIGAPTATTGSGDLETDEIVSTTPIYGTASENTAGDLTFNITAELSSGTSPNSFINFSTVAELL